jgi:secreted trypsin-like serine protease
MILHRRRLASASLLLAGLVFTAHASSAQSPRGFNRVDPKILDLDAEVSYRIVGGEPAQSGAWPWQVVMYMRGSNGGMNMRCGASLIDSKWVLTAAHCVGSQSPQDYQFVEGTNSISNPLDEKAASGKILKVSRLIPHEAYNATTQENDIAVFELATPATSRPVQLSFPEKNPLEAPDTKVTVTGWGTLKAMKGRNDALTDELVRPGDPRYFTTQLMEVEIPVISEETCQKTYQNKVIDHRVICAGLAEGGKDSCQGDSGGPLVTRAADGEYRQIGVVSFGRLCALKDTPGVYSRVSAFQDWLQTNTGVPFAQGTTVASQTPAPAAPPVQYSPPAHAPAANPARDNAAGISVSFVQGDTLKVGKVAQFKVTAQKSGFLLLIDITPDGKMTQIYPNARSLSISTGAREKSNFVEANHPVLVSNPKNPYEGFEFRTEPPFGEGLLLAILSADPLKSVPLPDAPKTMNKDEALGYFAGLTGELNRDLEVSGVEKPRDWSFATQPYRIVQ